MADYDIHTAQVFCPVPRCDGRRFNHEEGSVESNLHVFMGPELDGVPMGIDYVISAATWPRWTLSIDVEPSEEEPMVAVLMAYHLTNAARFCTELNKEAGVTNE